MARQRWLVDDAYSEYKRALPQLIDCVGINEATTRLRLIDTVLFDVLKWDKFSEIDVEKYCRAGFADYVFLDPGHGTSLVLEAKRDETVFVLGDKVYDSRPVPMALISKECPDAYKAFRQAASYAHELGTRYVAITNGWQWIFALTTVTNQPLDERQAFIFESLEAINIRFSDFWNCFSKIPLRSNTPSQKLLESRKAPAPSKLSSGWKNYPEPFNPGQSRHALADTVELVWDDATPSAPDRSFLESCYVKPSSTEGQLSIAAEVIRRRRNSDEITREKAIASGDATKLIENFESDRPIIVLGKVGRGKSTFLKYLRLIESEKTLRRYIQIEIDFLHNPQSSAQVSKYIYDTICKSLLAIYDIDIEADDFARGVLHIDLLRFKDSVKGKAAKAMSDQEYQAAESTYLSSLIEDTNAYLGKVFHHIRVGQDRSVAIFFDNLDRRLPDIQEQAFLVASAIASDWDSLVFVCLRHETFQRSTNEGVLDSVAPKVISVTAPATNILLRKRFAYAATVAQGEHGEDLIKKASLGRELAADLPATSNLFQILERSVAKSRPFAQVFDAATNGNARKLLRTIGEYLVNIRMPIDEMQNLDADEEILLDKDDAIEYLLYKEKKQFDPQNSILINAFDTYRSDPAEHFTRLFAIEYLSRKRDLGDGTGFTNISEIEQYVCQLGYTVEHVDETLKYLYEKKCLETVDLDLEWSAVENLRLTRLGKFHFEHLVRSPIYFHAMAIDTPIIDDDSRKEIAGELPSNELTVISRAFLRYLDKCIMDVADKAAHAIWNAVALDLGNAITDLETSLFDGGWAGND